MKYNQKNDVDFKMRQNNKVHQVDKKTSSGEIVELVNCEIDLTLQIAQRFTVKEIENYDFIKIMLKNT